MLLVKEQPEKDKEKETRPGVSLASYRQFFRELDMELLSVLQCGLLSRSLLDSEYHTKVSRLQCTTSSLSHRLNKYLM